MSAPAWWTVEVYGADAPGRPDSGQLGTPVSVIATGERNACTLAVKQAYLMWPAYRGGRLRARNAKPVK